MTYLDMYMGRGPDTPHEGVLPAVVWTINSWFPLRQLHIVTSKQRRTSPALHSRYLGTPALASRLSLARSLTGSERAPGSAPAHHRLRRKLAPRARVTRLNDRDVT